MVKRLFDLWLVLFSAFPVIIISLLILMTIRLSSGGPAIYWSDRVGVDNKIFRMPKFRTMRVDTPPVATHILQNSENYITSFGRFLRKTSLDELPQLWSIFKGDMSFVGPRPALFNQFDLITLRTEAGIHKLAPGLTGWAQVNGRDELQVSEKVRLDIEYLKRRSFLFDMKIIILTAFKIVQTSDISH